MSINLTNHKEKVLPNGKTTIHKPHLINQLDRANQFEGKFDKLFCAVGHSFTMSFDIIRESYWLEYDILDYDDCHTYDTIYFFIRKNIPFSLDVLARKMKVSKGTLRERLDNLENAELLEIVKINDARGQYNGYLLKSPLFKREMIEFDSKYHLESNRNKSAKTIRQKFHDKNLPLPTEFLDEHADRLRYQVKRNNVRRVRLFLRDKLKSAKFKRLAAELRQQSETRQFVWKEILHTLGSVANDFEQFIFSHTKQLAVIPQAKGEFKQALTRFVKKFCEQFNLVYNTWFVDKAEKLFEFFRIRLRIPKSKVEETFYNDEPGATEMSDIDETIEEVEHTPIFESARTRVKEIISTGRNWSKTIETLTNTFKVFPLTAPQINELIKEFIPVQYQDKLKVELRN